MFRFMIRDVLWLTVVVALAVGWWLDNRSTAAALAKTERRAEELSVQNGELLQERTKFHNMARAATRELEKATGQQLIWEYRED
ncbi:MAG TPA: hypothetical protein VFV87_11410 [Pirellulaceae bacterium]|nr:hypothetical protein [Pirellulaceae bacterium]